MTANGVRRTVGASVLTPPTRDSVEGLEHSFSALRAAFDSTVDAILIADANGRIFGYNGRFAAMWNLPDALLHERDDQVLLAHAMRLLKDPEAFRARVQALYASPELESHDRLELTDGRVVERYSVPQRLGDTIIGRVWTFRDVTAIELTQAQLRASEARFRAVFDHAAVGIALIEADGRIAATNPALRSLLGYGASELHDRRFYHLVPSEDADGIASAVAAIASGDAPSLSVEQRYTRRDGEVVWAAVTMSRATASDGTIDGIIAMVQDITTRKSLEARLTHQASHDPLTNLANRTLFRSRVELALQRAANRDQVVVMFLDLDNFKSVNDSLGHGAGDQLLVTAAARLLNATRGSDTVARLGGDEFAILLENVRDDAEAGIVAERLARTMRQPILVGAESVVVGVSIGIARAHDGTSADEVLRNADVAMYTAKGSGKGHYEFFEPSMHAAAVDRLELEGDLRRAVTDGEFLLYYQPLVELESGDVVGVEALLRWAHPRRGIVDPTDFIPVAEENGLVVPIGRWVLAEACRQAQTWWRELPESDPRTMSVNVSGRQLQDPMFVSDVAQALADSGLPPARLVLEITETVIMHRSEAMLHRLEELKGLGVHLAIDDFGTGYSSLSYLQQFPIDIIKIDKEFVEGMERTPAGAALTRTIIGLGWTLGLSTVAEGIERSAQRTTLHELGCEMGQGFLFARPLPPDEIAEHVMRPRAAAPTPPR
jgi:diguanylate cyclase (GGDEF)-like protein/PAS domain S-box-containing protein